MTAAPASLAAEADRDRRGTAADPLGAEAARFVHRAGFTALVATAAVAMYAALELRPLYADAAYYLQRILEFEDFFLAAPARRTVEWIRQTPVLAAAKFGVTDLRALSFLLSLSFALTPIAITALCWTVLPRERKAFFVFPLLHFFAGTLAGIFSAQQEGAAAAAGFWFILLFLLFRTTNTRAVDISIALSVPIVVLHEAMLFLGPVLAFAAAVRAREAPVRADRIAFVLLALWCLIAAAIQVDFIANPRHAGHGAGYLRDFLKGAWLVGENGSINLSAALGMAGLALVGVLALLQMRDESRWRRTGWMLVVGFGGIAACALVFLAVADRMLDMGPQFRSRNHCLLLSLPLALAALYAYLRPDSFRVSVIRQAAVLCAVMAAAGAAWQIVGVVQWSRSLAVFRSMLSENRGFVEWDEALARLPPERRRLMRLMIHEWVVSPMSIVLSPGGKVSTIVGVTKPRGFRPFDPLDPEKLPGSRYWDTAPYRATLAGQTPGWESR